MMKKYIRRLSLLLALCLLLVPLAGCNSNEDDEDEADETESGLAEIYSAGIDRDGFWEDINALDYMEDFDYEALVIPADAHRVPEDKLLYQIDVLMSGYMSRIQITDRAVAYGDVVNIDYVGTLNGVEIDGGSTLGVGLDIVIEDVGATDSSQSYLDEFVDQLAGRMPGETLDIEVTFPDDYYDETLMGQTAVFETTVNYIVEHEELNDDFVEENLSSSNGWTSVEEMTEGMRESIQTSQVQEYIEEYLRTEVPVSAIPDSMMEYQEDVLLYGYWELAEYNGMELEEYLETYEGFSSVEECLEDAHNDLVEAATYLLVVQAVAEDVGITVDDDDLDWYSEEHLWSTDMSLQVEHYGMGYVKQTVLAQKVIDYIAEHAELA